MPLRLLGYLITLLRRFPWSWPLLVIAAGGWYGYEIWLARPALVYQGEPRVLDWRRPSTWNRTLRNHDFLLGYSDLRGNPLWVSYRLTPLPVGITPLKRPSHFLSDWRSFTRISHDDYVDSGYDRGHMAPNHAISVLYGRAAQRDTFLMTNVTPQQAALNQKLWERLEEVELDHFTRLGEIWVLTGPIFDDQIERLPSAWRVEIPDAFYKVYAAPQAHAAPRLLAFIMPQRVRGNEPLDRYLVSVDKVEQLTGLDFFPELPLSIAGQIEAEINPAPWDLAAVARQASRYNSRQQPAPRHRRLH